MDDDAAALDVLGQQDGGPGFISLPMLRKATFTSSMLADLPSEATTVPL